METYTSITYSVHKKNNQSVTKVEYNSTMKDNDKMVNTYYNNSISDDAQNESFTKTLKDKKLSAFRNQKIGFIFQFHQLLPEFTAIENVCIPAWINGTSKKEAEARARELFEILNKEQVASLRNIISDAIG